MHATQFKTGANVANTYNDTCKDANCAVLCVFHSALTNTTKTRAQAPSGVTLLLSLEVVFFHECAELKEPGYPVYWSDRLAAVLKEHKLQSAYAELEAFFSADAVATPLPTPLKTKKVKGSESPSSLNLVLPVQRSLMVAGHWNEQRSLRVSPRKNQGALRR
eukprot:3224868-Rhodomonas_salina.1